MNCKTIRMLSAIALATLLLQPICSMAQAPASGKVEKMALRVGERDRTYLVYVPEKLGPGRPLVLALHGTFGNGEGMRHETGFGFEKLASQYGFVVVYPDALMAAWNDCRKHNSSRPQNVDDVGFLREVIRVAVAQYGSDPGRVFLFGFSGGAHMAYRMAWEAPQDIAAVASVGGNLPPPDAVTCMSNDKTPRVLMIKGKADTGDPFDGGPHPLSGSVLSAHASAATFASQNGLGESTAEVAVSAKAKFVAWPASGRPLVALYSIDGLGHMVPIEWRDNIDGPVLAWKFFTAP